MSLSARFDPSTVTGQVPTILVLNSGSSSLKFALFDAAEDAADEAPRLEGSANGIGRASGNLRLTSRDGTVQLVDDHVMESQAEAFLKLTGALATLGYGQPVAIGHRVVHGGPHLRTHQRLTPEVRRQLREAIHLAPLHIPLALSLIDQACAVYPDTPQVLCFDTTFHQSLPPRASHFPLPGRYADAGIIRYGFHGLSYESIQQRLGDSLPPRAVFAHLGNGASVCAVWEGKSIDTSMGLTPTGGVPMGTRCGDLDPGVMLYLMRSEALDADALEALLNKECGLMGLSRGESDMQLLLARSQQGDDNATLAIDVFTTAIRKAIGAYAALMGGIDLLVLTGGIGSNSAEVRHRICAGLGFLGLSEGSPTSGNVRVMPAQEEVQIARHCRSILHIGCPP